MKYLSVLAKLNVTEADMLKNKKLRDMAEAIKACKESEAVIKAKIKNNDGDIDELNADLSEIQGDIANIDNSLVEAIPSWNQNRLRFLANVGSKSGAPVGRKPKNAPAKPVAPQAAPAAAPAPAPATPAPQDEPAPVVAAADGGQAQTEPKKKGNGGAFVLFGILALVVTVGAVNMFKKQ